MERGTYITRAKTGLRNGITLVSGIAFPRPIMPTYCSAVREMSWWESAAFPLLVLSIIPLLVVQSTTLREKGRGVADMKLLSDAVV